jgi:hypothetical protein
MDLVVHVELGSEGHRLQILSDGDGRPLDADYRLADD